MPLTCDEEMDDNLKILLRFYPDRTLAGIKAEVDRAKHLRASITRALQDVLALSPSLPPANTRHLPSLEGRRAASDGGSFVSIHVVRARDNRILRLGQQAEQAGSLLSDRARVLRLVDELRWAANAIANAQGVVEPAIQAIATFMHGEPAALGTLGPLRDRRSMDQMLTDPATARSAASELAILLSIIGERDLEAPLAPILAEILAQEWDPDGDPLGCYNGHERRIELFWPEIALVAALCRVSILDLAVKVLTHELAHALTDAGLDTTLQTWSFHAFRKSHTYVKEGLAQFFTLEALKRSNRPEVRGAQRAFHALLPHQGPAYNDWTHWLPNHHARGELIRLSLLAFRVSDRPASLDDFLDTLHRSQALHKASNANPNAIVGMLQTPRGLRDAGLDDDRVVGVKA